MSISSTRSYNGEQAADDVHVSPQRHPHHRRHVTAWRYLARNGEFGAGARLCASTRQLPPLILLSRRSKGAALVDSTSDKSDGVSELTRVLWEITKVGREIKISTYISLCHFFLPRIQKKISKILRYWDWKINTTDSNTVIYLVVTHNTLTYRHHMSTLTHSLSNRDTTSEHRYVTQKPVSY